MDKLTRQQAEYLIDKILNEERAGEFGDHVQSIDIVETINQCTAKDFPESTINSIAKSQINIGKRDDDCDAIFVNIPNEYAYLTPNEFKLFADLVNKVVGYLDAEAD